MNLLSFLKSAVLSGADSFNGAVGGPTEFTRRVLPDPSEYFTSSAARREFIAIASEMELEAFVSDGAYLAQKPNDMGDCAIWQGVYTAMTALRWHTSPTQENQKAMLAAAVALSHYFLATGPGSSILLRGALPITLEHSFFDIDPNNKSRYFLEGSTGSVYVCREDASLDSLLGVMFGAAMLNRFGDAASRSVLATPLTRFATGFAKAGYKITNRDGSPTTYGDCTPKLFQAPVRILAGVLPSLVAGTPDWKALAKAYAPEFSTTDTQIPGKISWVNAHLAILATLTFVCAAPADAPGFGYACVGLRTLMDKYADAGNSFLIYACALLGVTPTTTQTDKAAKALLEFSLGPKPKSGFNSSIAPALQPVPAWQRPPADNFWQRSPYPNVGSESREYNRLDYLIAHYLDRANTLKEMP